MACTYTYKGKTYSEKEFLNIIEERDSDIGEEVMAVRSLLPHVPFKMIKGLMNVPGGIAQGVFYKNMAIISSNADTGTAYHEAFHAVSQMYLTDSQLDNLYREAKETYGDRSRLELEEDLAEGFRQFMEDKGELELSPTIKFFYDLIQNIINVFRSNQGKIFNKLRDGRYDYKPINSSEAELYSKVRDLPYPSDFKEEVVNDFISRFLNVYELHPNAPVELIKKQTLVEFKKTYNKSLELGNKAITDNLFEIIKDESFEAFAEIAFERIKGFGYKQLEGKIAAENKEVVKNDNLEDSDLNINEETDGSLAGLVSHLNISTKEAAHASTRILLSTLKDPNKESEHFGTYVGQAASSGKLWGKLKTILAGSIATTEKSLVEVMNARIVEASHTEPIFAQLTEALESASEATKVRFYSDFSGQSVNYIGTLIDKNDAGDTIVKVTTGDEQSKGKTLLKDAISSFTSEHVSPDGTVSSETIGVTVGTFNNIQKRIKDILAQGGDVSDGFYDEVIPNLFSKIGVSISGKAIRSYVAENNDGEVDLFMTELSYIFNPKGSNKQPGYFNLAKLHNTKWDPEVNFMNKNKQFRALMIKEGENSNMTGESSVLASDGKVAYKDSLHSYISKVTEKFRNGELIDDMLSSTYHSKSNWLAEAKQQVASDQGLQLKVNTFLFNKVLDDRDRGTDSSDTLMLDAMVDRMNKTLGDMSGPEGIQKSILSVLTYADKNTTHEVEGMSVKNYDYVDGYSESAVDELYNYMLAEIDRISESARTESNIDYYSDKGSLKSFWFPEIGKGTELDKKIGLFNKNGTHNTSDPVVANALKSHIANALSTEINKQIEAIPPSMIDRKGKIIGLSTSVQDNYGSHATAESGPGKDGFHEMIADYTIRSMVANIEFTMLFAGDPAFYKDLAKRTPSSTAQGNDTIHLESMPDIAPTFNVAVGHDIEQQSGLFSQYFKDFEKKGLDTSLLNPYKKDKDNDGVNVGDAQGYLMPQRFKDLARMLGKWEDSHNAMYAQLMNDTATEETYIELQDLMRNMYFPAGQPLKGMFHSLVKDGNLMRPVFLKYSQATLWPGLIKGTKLEKLAAAMEKSGTDEFVFKSGVKVGSKDVVNIDFDGDIELTPFELDNEFWKLQVDLDGKYDSKQKALVGSQPKKNIIANIIGRMIGERKGEDVANDIHNVERALSDLGRNSIEDAWGINENGTITNKKALYDTLLTNLKDEQAAHNVIELVENGVELDSIIQYIDKIESVLYSKVTTATTKLTSPGGTFIQMSNAGLTQNKGLDKKGLLEEGILDEEVEKGLHQKPITNRNGTIYLKDATELQGPRKDENGNTIPGDIFLPNRVIEQIPNLEELLASGTLTGEMVAELLGDTVTNLVGYRIPNQGMSSIDVLNIAGILPPHIGDTIVTYTEVTAKTGSDFDIDKMYVMMPHTRWNPKLGKNGRVEVIRENIEELNTKLDYLKEKLKEGRGKVGNKVLTKEISKVKNKLKKGLENERIRLWGEVLLADDTYGDLVTPLDSEFLKDDAYYVNFLEELRDNPERVEKVLGVSVKDIIDASQEDREQLAKDFLDKKQLRSLEFASPLYQQEVKRRNLAGKAGVGQTANHLTHHALAQEKKLFIKYKLGIGNMTADGNVDVSGTFVNEIRPVKEEVTEGGEIKTGVSDVFKDTPELAEIGSEQEYSNYLNNIFPDSKVKDIVYHNGDITNKDTFKKSDGGIHFSTSLNRTLNRDSSKNLIFAILNIANANLNNRVVHSDSFQRSIRRKEYLYDEKTKDGRNITIDRFTEEYQEEGLNRQEARRKAVAKIKNLEKDNILPLDKESSYDAVIGLEQFIYDEDYVLAPTKIGEYNIDSAGDINIAVKNPEQTHILGSKKDIQGFKEFASKSKVTEEVKETKSLQELNKGKKTITGVISAWLNAYVDNAKDPYITLINNNTKTANVVFMMLRAGVEPEFVNRFVSQPMIKKYVEAQFEGNNKLVPSQYQHSVNAKGQPIVLPTIKPKVVDGIITLEPSLAISPYGKAVERNGSIFNDTSTEATDLSTFTTKDLEDALMANDYDTQLGLLNKFLEIQFYAEELNDAVKAGKNDTKGAFGNAGENIAARELRKKVSENDIIGNFDDLYDGTMLGGFYENGTEFANDIFSNKLIGNTSFAYNAIKRIYDISKTDDNYATNSDINGKIIRELRSYVYSQTPSLNRRSEAERASLVKELPALLTKLKKEYPNNALLTELIVNTIKDDSTIELRNAPRDQFEKDELWLAWENLLNSSDPQLKSLGHRLVEYSHFTSSFKKKLTSFHDLIPPSVITASGIDQSVKDFLANSDDTLVNDFVDQFVRNNHSDTDIFRQLKFKKLKATGPIALGASKSKGFAVDMEDTSTGLVKDGAFKEYASVIASNGETIFLYKFIGISSYKVIGISTSRGLYERVPLLSGNDGKNIRYYNSELSTGPSVSKEYSLTGKQEMSILSNRFKEKVLPLGGAKFVRKKGIIGFENVEGEFNLVQEVVNGEKTLVLKHGKISFGPLTSEYESSIRQAVLSLREMGLKKIESIIKNQC